MGFSDAPLGGICRYKVRAGSRPGAGEYVAQPPVRAAFSGAFCSVRVGELEVREHRLQRLAALLRQEAAEGLQGLDREPRLLEVAVLLGEAAEGERGEEGRALERELLGARQLNRR
jgi:hypothetical protein